MNTSKVIQLWETLYGVNDWGLSFGRPGKYDHYLETRRTEFIIGNGVDFYFDDDERFLGVGFTDDDTIYPFFYVLTRYKDKWYIVKPGTGKTKRYRLKEIEKNGKKNS